MQDKLDQLKARLARISDLRRAASVLSWDQETHMPPGGVQARAEHLGTLRGLAHELFITDEVGMLLDDLQPYAEQLPYDSDEASLIRVMRREYDKAVRVPVAWVEQNARTTSLAHHTWVQAKNRNQFSLFQDDLARVVDLQKQWAEYFAPYDNIYDPLLDRYERSLDTAQVSAVFAGMKPALVELVQAIAERADAVDDSLLRRPLDAQRQLAFGQVLSARLGYDYQRGRLDVSAHPFTSGFSPGDVRITTLVDPDNFFRCVKSSIHEAGHAMHGQNLKPSLFRTGLDWGAGMAIGESQSRFYENIIGRSRAFWAYFLPTMKAIFAPLLDDVALEPFYRAINKVEPSLIRVKADEVTYGLHIVLRFELEDDLLNGRVAVADLPQEWNARMEAYLGIVPPTDTDGVLQDVHWSSGMFGYFPDYQLGSLFAVQLWEAMQRDLPAISGDIAAGRFEGVLGWLREHVMQHGRKFTLPELSERVTGVPLSWEPYVHYVREKMGEIYGF
jgi:carboxypeptidase Taq